VEIALVSLLAAAGLAYYARMAARLPRLEPPPPGFGRGDAVLASLLGLWFVNLIAESFGKKMTVNAQVIVASIVLYFCLVAIIVGFLTGRGRSPAALFGLRWPDWKHGCVLAFGSLAAAFPVIYLAGMAAQFLGAKGEPQDVLLFLQSAPLLSDRLLMIFMAVVAAPIAEETIFRGYLHGVIRQYGGRWCGIAVNSMLFAAIHGHIPSLPGLFVLAVALSLVYERTGSLWAPILMHSAFNSLTVILALSWPGLVK
jgi:membrane protease YdiL (CAAX protease family)